MNKRPEFRLLWNQAGLQNRPHRKSDWKYCRRNCGRLGKGSLEAGNRLKIYVTWIRKCSAKLADFEQEDWPVASELLPFGACIRVPLSIGKSGFRFLSVEIRKKISFEFHVAVEVCDGCGTPRATRAHVTDVRIPCRSWTFVTDVWLRAPLERTWQMFEFRVAVERLWRMCDSALNSSERDGCWNSALSQCINAWIWCLQTLGTTP